MRQAIQSSEGSEMSFVEYEQGGPVVTITINRPERMNAIDRQVADELVAAWDSGSTTTLRSRCSPARATRRSAPGATSRQRSRETRRCQRRPRHNRGERPGALGPSRWTDICKPTIAAVNGVAYAGGLEWACWTDLAIADAHATFGVTCRRWNIGLADGAPRACRGSSAFAGRWS